MSSTRRIFLDKQHSELFAALSGLSNQVATALKEAGIGREVAELVNMRISEIHGCAFCLDMHLARAQKAEVGPRKLVTLPAWRDTSLFSDQERAALELAEMVAETPQVTDPQTYDDARQALGDEAASAVLWAAVTISAFNAVSILSGHPVR
jgi:AhpD family alkylhydroperoxidase